MCERHAHRCWAQNRLMGDCCDLFAIAAQRLCSRAQFRRLVRSGRMSAMQILACLQRMPVAAVAGEPGGFDREYGSDPPLPDRRQQTLEARSSDAAARAAEIIIVDLGGGPAKLHGAIGEPVLTPSALLVVHELIRRRLADVDEGAACEMVSRDLGHRRPPRPPAPRRSRAAGLPPTPPRTSRIGKTTIASGERRFRPIPGNPWR
jgi:hypothetical protein